jgi:ATP-binding protein involved in chromosome partitioning
VKNKPIINCIGVAAGKGGVGKSSVTVNLALALAASGARVGILDADLYGPSIGKMLPKAKAMEEIEGWMIPAEGLGIHYISLAHFPMGQKATIVRAPIANQIISEFLHHVKWPDLDFLLIDFPPGTGDIQLTLMQQASLIGTILVTTPQEVALLDVRKAYQMFKEMQVPVLGVIENMSYFEETSNKKVYPFGQGGGRSFCLECDLKLIGEIPIDPHISNCCDQGCSLIERFPGNSSTILFEKIAREIQLSLITNKLEEKEVVKSFELIWDETM